MAEEQMVQMLSGISRTLTKAANDINNMVDKIKYRLQKSNSKEQKTKSEVTSKEKNSKHKSKDKSNHEDTKKEEATVQRTNKTNNNSRTVEKVEKITKEQHEKYTDVPKKKSAYFLFGESVRSALQKIGKECSLEEMNMIIKNKWDKHPEEEKQKLKSFATSYNKNQYKQQLQKYKQQHPGYDQYLNKLKKNKQVRKQQRNSKEKTKHEEEQEQEEGSLSQDVRS